MVVEGGKVRACCLVCLMAFVRRSGSGLFSVLEKNEAPSHFGGLTTISSDEALRGIATVSLLIAHVVDIEAA